MSVANINELEQILLRELKHSNKSLHIIKISLNQLIKEIENLEEIIFHIGPKLVSSKGLIEKILLIKNQEIYLEDEKCQHEYEILMPFIRQLEIDEIEEVPQILDTFQHIELPLLRGIKKEGFVKEYDPIPVGGLLALYYLNKGNIQNRQNVLIYGASGSNGTFAVQLAKFFESQVTAVCSNANIDLLKSLGAEKVVDYAREDLTSMKKHYDLIFDAVGKKKSSKVDFKKILNKKGNLFLLMKDHQNLKSKN
jgi:hypothetical protein